MRFHVISVPHTITKKEYSACAFTQKVLKFCSMMMPRGHTIFHYGHEDSIVECTEKIAVTNNAIFDKIFGNYDWKANGFLQKDELRKIFQEKTSAEITLRKQPGDYLLLFFGCGQLKEDHKDLLAVEPGIGCFNRPCTDYSVYESYAVMHYVYGKYNIKPRFFDCVIPNYFDLNDFKFIEDRGRFSVLKQPYALFVGRICFEKGLCIAYEMCKELKIKLVVVGQGDPKNVISNLVLNDISDELGVSFIGYVEPHERAILMQGARCLICPTTFAEPFGGVSVEAQLCGTPVISTDWGAFPENIIHGVTGYRCRTMDHFYWALSVVASLDREFIKKRAEEKWGLERIAIMYEEYFTMLKTLYKKGFYEPNPSRTSLEWLSK